MHSDIKKKIDNEDFSGAILNMVFLIKDNKLSEQELHKLILYLNKKDMRNYYLLEKPITELCEECEQWNEEYYTKLELAITNGDISEEMLRHLIKVSRYIHKGNNSLPLWIVVVLIIGVLLFLLVYFSFNSDRYISISSGISDLNMYTYTVYLSEF